MEIFKRVPILFFVFLVGCAAVVPLQRDQIAAIDRSSSPEILESILAGATEVTQFEISIKGSDYFVRTYNLQTGTRSDTLVICSPVCLPIPTTVPVMTEYSVIQALPSKTLFAWGTLEELSKDSDSAVSSVMPVIKAKIAERNKR